MTLDRNPWGRPYRTVMSRMARRVQTDGLNLNRVRSIVDELFLMRPMESKDRIVRNRNGEE